jgi:hypothetical protein
MSVSESFPVEKPLIFKKIEIPWLEKGLVMLAEVGTLNFNIDRLARNVGVAKSSFYYLFNSKEDYYLRLVNYWAYKSTYQFTDELMIIKSPKAKIGRLIRLILDDRVGGLAWTNLKNIGIKNKDVKRIITKVEMDRLDFVRVLFNEYGFNNEESLERAKGFMYLIIGWSMLHWSDPEASKYPENDLLTLIGLLGLQGIEIK